MVKTHQLVENNRNEIKEVALLRNGTLTGEQIEKVIDIARSGVADRSVLYDKNFVL